MNEAETRAELIDPALKAVGWGAVEGSRVNREYPITLGRIEGHGRRGKPLIADYVLVYRNTKLAVIEAKAFGESLTEGLAQAKDYSGKLAVRFAYSTNGQGVYCADMRRAKKETSRAIRHREELWDRTFAQQNQWRDRFADVPFEDRGGYFQGRYYQDIAIDRVLEAIAAEEKSHPAHARDRDGQDLYRVSNCLEAFSQPLELEPRAIAPSSNPISRRPQYPGRSGLQRLFRIPRRRTRAHRS